MAQNVPDIGGVKKTQDASYKNEFQSEVSARKSSSQSFTNVKSMGMDKSSMPKFKDNPPRKM